MKYYFYVKLTAIHSLERNEIFDRKDSHILGHISIAAQIVINNDVDNLMIHLNSMQVKFCEFKKVSTE